ncbi:MAG: hypothetical protein Q7K98_06850 [Candidatus Omnitrophota bacterium]|nr:hypothetical protein [Candidatus Omnitrophota bacterium]
MTEQRRRDRQESTAGAGGKIRPKSCFGQELSVAKKEEKQYD